MSERDDSADVVGCIVRAGVMVFVVALAIVSAVAVADAIERRDNWIRDLQRRVGQLESERR